MSRPKTEDLPDTDPDSSRNQAIRLEQDRILHRNQPLAALMLVGVTLIIAFAYRAGTGSVAWGAAMLALVTIRLMVDHHLWHKNDDAPAGPVWRTAYLAGTLLTGLLWAVASPLFLNGSELAEQSFGVLIIVGVAAGAVPVMSVYTPIYTAYAALVVLPLAAVLAMGQGALHQLLALACLALLAVLIRSARMMSDQLMRAVRQTQQLDAANKSLAGLMVYRLLIHAVNLVHVMTIHNDGRPSERVKSTLINFRMPFVGRLLRLTQTVDVDDGNEVI